ncbi:MAG: A/G-specific adenine glycosylase [Spirochaetes bacterium]|nr:A/G-specific adenine glycosylase [Spirochaetota bacterium]
MIRKFRSVIYGYYRKHRRDFPWRRTDDPYHILVSEIMLQQTQVARVSEKFVEFVGSFPTVEALAAAPLARVLAAWQGMGYNRRARYLHELASAMVSGHGGAVPDDPAALAKLPGIGRATAASICAFAFNRPTVFIETNIRAVFIHFFFHGKRKVSDGDILPLAEAALDRKDPHHWYSALMDYGAMLKRRHPNPSRKSAHHQRQKPFEGSRRQLRGMVLRALLEHPGITAGRLSAIMGRPEDEVADVVDGLVKEKLVSVKGRALYL